MDSNNMAKYIEAKDKVRVMVNIMNAFEVRWNEAQTNDMRLALMIALDRLPCDDTHDWMSEVLDLFDGVPSAIFWSIDGLDSGASYSQPTIRNGEIVCREPAKWLDKVRIVRNSTMSTTLFANFAGRA